MFQRILWFYCDHLDHHVINLNWEFYKKYSCFKGTIECLPSLILDSKICFQICKPIPFLRLKLEQRKALPFQEQIEFKKRREAEKEEIKLHAIAFEKYLQELKHKPPVVNLTDLDPTPQNPQNAADAALGGLL